jgi:hypothetical protein
MVVLEVFYRGIAVVLLEMCQNACQAPDEGMVTAFSRRSNMFLQ